MVLKVVILYYEPEPELRDNLELMEDVVVKEVSVDKATKETKSIPDQSGSVPNRSR